MLPTYLKYFLNSKLRQIILIIEFWYILNHHILHSWIDFPMKLKNSVENLYYFFVLVNKIRNICIMIRTTLPNNVRKTHLHTKYTYMLHIRFYYTCNTYSFSLFSMTKQWIVLHIITITHFLFYVYVEHGTTPTIQDQYKKKYKKTILENPPELFNYKK